MKLISRSRLLVVVCALAGLGAQACGSAGSGGPSQGANPGGGSDVGSAGSVSLGLQIADGVDIASVTYAIAGNGFTKTGTLDVSSSHTITGLIGGIPAGKGYTITLGTGDAGVSCTGSATFDVVAGAVSKLTVGLECRLPPASGSVSIDGTVNVCPRIDDFTVATLETSVGGTIALTGAASDADGAPSALTYTWSATGGTLASPSSPSTALTCTAPGSVTVTLTVSDGDCTDTATTAVTCSAGAAADAGAPIVRINEVESSGGVPGDWAELTNIGTATADLSGWIFKDNDDTHGYVIPAGTTLAPGAFLVLDEANFGFGLGAPDATRIFDPAGDLVDSFSWTTHATTTYGRCPDGTGDFVTTGSSTKDLPNDCSSLDAGADATTADGATDAGGDATMDGASPDGSSLEAAWPGSSDVTTVDVANTFGTNLSGLTYQPATASAPAVLWGVRNGPSTVFRLLFDGTTWNSTTTDDWSAGKNITYTDGTGAPDSEGITKPDWDASTIYVSTERDNDNNNVSRLSVLSYDSDAPGSTLTATHEWNLTSDLPVAGPNLGLEAITSVPDSFLVASGFVDQSTGQLYDPSRYPNHGTGIFLVGLEANGIVYGYVFDQGGTSFHRVATFPSGNVSIMDLAFDREVGYLYADCDNTCGNKISLFTIETDPASPARGSFQIRTIFDRPAAMPDINNEGITFAPEAECSGGQKSFFWSDDDQTDGHALRHGTIPCGAYLTP